jgi:hypothetical protein
MAPATDLSLPSLIFSLLTMLSVGFCEEVAKLMALLLGMSYHGPRLS